MFKLTFDTYSQSNDSKYNEPGSPEEIFSLFFGATFEEDKKHLLKKINFFYGFSMIELGLCETAKYIACRHMCCSASMPAEA